MSERKVISVSFKTEKMTIANQKDAFKALKKTLEKGNQRGSPITVRTGPVKLADIFKDGAVDVSNQENFLLLRKWCNKYSVDYAVIASKAEVKEYLFLFRAEDNEKLKQFISSVSMELDREWRRMQAAERRKKRKIAIKEREDG